MDVADICAQILDGLRGGFAVIAPGAVHVPQHAQLVAGEGVEQIAQALAVAVDAAGLDQHGHVVLRRHGQKLAQRRAHGFLAAVGIRAHIGNAQLGGQADQLLQLVARGRVGQIAGRIQTGNFEILFAHFANGGGEIVLVKGAAALEQGLHALRVADLHAAKVHFDGRVDPFLPAAVLPAAGRKGELHACASSYTILFSALMYAWMLAPTMSVEMPRPE